MLKQRWRKRSFANSRFGGNHETNNWKDRSFCPGSAKSRKRQCSLTGIPHLSGPRYTLATIATRIREFIGNAAPEFWGYYADYDWVVFCQIFGAMIDLPEGWPMFCLDLKQLCIEQGNPNLPKQQSTEHHALNDARWNKAVYNFLTRLSGLICDIRERAERNNP